MKVVGFFALFYTYLWLRVQPQVEYQHLAPTFQFSLAYLRPFLAYPGGLADYASAFLAQLSYSQHLGAFNLTVIGLLSYVATYQILKRLDACLPELAAYAPPFAMLLLKDRLYSPAASIYLGLLVSLGLAAGYLWWAWAKAAPRLAACWLGAAIVFYVAGAGPCALFVVICTLSHIVPTRQWLPVLGCASSLLVLPIGAYGFQPTAKPQILWGNPMSEKLLISVYLALSLVVVLSALLPVVLRKRIATPTRSRSAKAEATPIWLETNTARQTLTWAFLLLGWAVVWFAFDTHRKSLAEIDYYSRRGEDAKVLTAAARAKRLDAASETRLYRALYHTGRLGEDLFSFTNQTVWTLMPALNPSVNACRAQSESAWELGQVVMAEHFAHEAMEWEGVRPDTLRLLARVNALLGRPQAARVFLNVLGQIPFQRHSAEAALRDLDQGSCLSDDKELTELRSRMVTYDQPHVTVPTEGILLQSLEANPRNRMAFEYLMTHLLLTRQIDRVVEELKRLKDFGGTEIPRHYEEAILLYQVKKSGAPVDLHGRQIRAATLDRFREFAAAMQRGASSTPAGKAALARDFGNTFWFYYISGRPTPPPAREPSAAHQ